MMCVLGLCSLIIHYVSWSSLLKIRIDMDIDNSIIAIVGILLVIAGIIKFICEVTKEEKREPKLPKRLN